VRTASALLFCGVVAAVNVFRSFKKRLFPIEVLRELQVFETLDSSVNQVLAAKNTGSLLLIQLSMKVSSGISHGGKAYPDPRLML